jgi:uncharacterized peroxidase-related enzyme
MPYISQNTDLPGIIGLMNYRTDTGKFIAEFTEMLLRGDSPLTRGEREVISTYVSLLNGCNFCRAAHESIARKVLAEESNLVDIIYHDLDSANISEKLKILLKIAAKVQKSGHDVTADDIQQAKLQGATDREIHDTVLISAAFCMFNRYVDGLSAATPEDPSVYEQISAQIVKSGYVSVMEA